MPPRGRNINYVSDDALTALVYAADRSVSQAERAKVLGEAQVRIADLAIEIPALRREQARRGTGPAQGLHRQSRPTPGRSGTSTRGR